MMRRHYNCCTATPLVETTCDLGLEADLFHQARCVLDEVEEYILTEEPDQERLEELERKLGRLRQRVGRIYNEARVYILDVLDQAEELLMYEHA